MACIVNCDRNPWNRMRQHEATGLRVAEWLQQQESIHHHYCFATIVIIIIVIYHHFHHNHNSPTGRCSWRHSSSSTIAFSGRRVTASSQSMYQKLICVILLNCMSCWFLLCCKPMVTDHWHHHDHHCHNPPLHSTSWRSPSTVANTQECLLSGFFSSQNHKKTKLRGKKFQKLEDALVELNKWL